MPRTIPMGCSIPRVRRAPDRCLRRLQSGKPSAVMKASAATAGRSGGRPWRRVRRRPDEVVPQGHRLRVLQLQPGLYLQLLGVPDVVRRQLQGLRDNRIEEGRCGDVDLFRADVAAIIDWPKAIRGRWQGRVRGAAVGKRRAARSARPDLHRPARRDALGDPRHHLRGGRPRARRVKINEAGRRSSIEVPGVGRAAGNTLKNPVTGEDNNVAIELETGFIWKRGDCGQGSFHVEAEGLQAELPGQ